MNDIVHKIGFVVSVVATALPQAEHIANPWVRGLVVGVGWLAALLVTKGKVLPKKKTD